MIMRVFFLDFQGTMRRADIPLNTEKPGAAVSAGRDFLKNWVTLGFACLERVAFVPWANFAGAVLLTPETAAEAPEESEASRLPTQGAEPLK